MFNFKILVALTTKKKYLVLKLFYELIVSVFKHHLNEAFALISRNNTCKESRQFSFFWNLISDQH